jgi:hypothetical protein
MVKIHTISNRITEAIKPPEKMINEMIDTIPSKFIPRHGFPHFILTNSLFHSYGMMFSKYQPSGSKMEEERFDFFRSQKVWALSCLESDKQGLVLLALKQRVENKKDYQLPIELVTFHEIGHHYYFDKNTTIEAVVDFNHEKESDIYGLACFVNYCNETGSNGYYEKFNGKTISRLERARELGLNRKNMMKVARKVIDEQGTL